MKTMEKYLMTLHDTERDQQQGINMKAEKTRKAGYSRSKNRVLVPWKIVSCGHTR